MELKTKEAMLRNYGSLQDEFIAPENVGKPGGCVYRFLKRAFDVVASGMGLVLLSPVFLIIALLIKKDSRGPVFFKHHRVGKNGKPLDILKFRSMVINAEDLILEFSPEQRDEWERYFKLDDDPRITKIGHILRKTSLDELPQLVNIFMGNLSVVGPRPITEMELERYGTDRDKFLSVTPGLTGYWQAYARSDCEFEKRMKMELFYVDHANLLWDLKIIFATVGAVFRGRGAK